MKRSNSKYTTTIEEYIQSKKANPPKRIKQIKTRKEKLNGFELLDEDIEVYPINSEMKTEINFPRNIIDNRNSY